MMDKRVKELWIAALRSGEYKQTTGALRRTKTIPGSTALAGHCCLGVLCAEYIKDTGKGGWTKGTNRDNFADRFVDLFTGERSVGFLPLSVRRWAGLREENPKVIIDNSAARKPRLAALNDTAWDFNQIADAIEKSL